MDPKIIKLYDEYTHKPLSREVFLKRLALLTGSLTAALNVLPNLEGNYMIAETSETDEDLFTEKVSFSVKSGNMNAYIARPAKAGKYPTVLVIHENRGLNAHIEDVARRAAKEGFLAVAPDALSSFGGTPANEDEARALFAKLDTAANLENFKDTVAYAGKRPDSTGKIGCVGFCWGGGIANQLAVNSADMKAAVAFYGRQPESTQVGMIKGAVQLHYAELDERINAGIAAYESALKENKIDYELYMYAGVNHAFHNNTSTARYNEAAAKLAWSRTVEFWKKKLMNA